MRNQTRQNFGFHSLMLYHWATETIMSEVFYEEVYYEVPSLIPHGDSKFFFVLQSWQHKNIFLQFNGSLKEGSCLQHYTALEIGDAAIQIFLGHVLTQSHSIIFAL